MHDIRQSELEEPIPEISLAEKYLKRKFSCGLRVQGFPGINLISYLCLAPCQRERSWEVSRF